MAVLLLAGSTTLLTAGGDPPQILAMGLAGMLIAFSIGCELDGRALAAAVAVFVAAWAGRDVADPKLNGFDIAIDAIVFAVPFVVGRVIRRREHTIAIVGRTADGRAEDAVRRERERIARELHDVIAHGITVMVVQADAARHGLPPGDEQTRNALEEIERSGRESLREMRRLLGLLREEGRESDDIALAPQPGLESLTTLVETVRQAGLRVKLRIDGKPTPLSPGVDLAAYRIVQEAFTNTLRHAGPADVTVEIGYRDQELRLRVADTGGANRSSRERGGNGLVGMRERARLYGGTLEARSEPPGFVVTASLPTGPSP